MNIYDELEWRGLIADCTDKPELLKRLATGPITLYCGFDPTADSLHVGHIVPLIALRRFQNLGHHPIAVAGGATGSIGDPSGKSAERQLLTKDQITANVDAVKPQLARLLDFNAVGNPARLMDNADWTAPVSFLDFLRDIGKHFTVNQMVQKESVRARMEDREVGISYTEFSYQLLQAFDFMHLKQAFGCELQIGGSDQWGNITAGIDLIRKKLGQYAFGLTLPLITKTDGTKFGKTEGGAVWLDPKRTSVEDFYQFWIRTDDRDIIKYLKFFTFLGREEVAALEADHVAKPEARAAHKALAREVTNLIHGESSEGSPSATPSATQGALTAAEIIYQKDLQKFTEADFEALAKHGNTKEVEKSLFDGPGIPLVDLMVIGGISQSKGQARKDVGDGGIKVGSRYLCGPDEPAKLGPVFNFVWPVKSECLIFNRYLLIRKGRRTYVLVVAK
jgi:tyrosyl-tRNA synthetase